MYGSRFLKRRSVLAAIFICSLLYFVTNIYKQVCSMMSSVDVPSRHHRNDAIHKAGPVYRVYTSDPRHFGPRSEVWKVRSVLGAGSEVSVHQQKYASSN